MAALNTQRQVVFPVRSRCVCVRVCVCMRAYVCVHVRESVGCVKVCVRVRSWHSPDEGNIVQSAAESWASLEWQLLLTRLVIHPKTHRHTK